MNLSTPPQASNAELLKATALAAAAAALLLLTVVLPAEYGRDPTGIGKALGLTALAEAEAPLKPTGGLPPTASEAVIASDAAFQSGEMSLSLQPGEGAEIKALMRAGGSFVFSWTASGPVNFDMHGERPENEKEYSSYWKDRAQTTAHGSFTAPFDGTHGWYWRNRGGEPVTVTVKLSGFYEKLYQP